MKYLEKLENKIRSAGWFTGRLQLKILLENEFEGFWGRATEDWESRVTIEVIYPGNINKSITVVGNRNESIDDVAKRVLDGLDSW